MSSCPVSSGPHCTKARIQSQKNMCLSEISFSEVDVQISYESEKRMLFSYLLKKMAPISPGTDELCVCVCGGGGLKIGPN